MGDLGIKQEFKDDVGALVQPGKSALMAVIRKATPDKVLEELSPYGGTVLADLAHPRRRGQVGGVSPGEESGCELIDFGRAGRRRWPRSHDEVSVHILGASEPEPVRLRHRRRNNRLPMARTETPRPAAGRWPRRRELPDIACSTTSKPTS